MWTLMCVPGMYLVTYLISWSEVVTAAVQLQRAVPSHEPSRSPSSPSLVRRRERVF